jgi:predicted small metal-binding protein
LEKRAVFYIPNGHYHIGVEMAKKFACSSIGMQCGWEASAKDENALMKQVAAHAKKAHNMSKIDDATMHKIRDAIEEE